MDHSSEAIQTKQEQTSPDKIEPVVVETTTVEEKEVDETDIQVRIYINIRYRLRNFQQFPHQIVD